MTHARSTPTRMDAATTASFRWLVAGGRAYLSAIHPERMQAGSGARFHGENGEEVRLSSIAHREEDFRQAIAKAGLAIEKKEDVVASGELCAAYPGWEKSQGRAMLQVWVLRKP